MGQRVECSVEFNGKASAGIALLEVDSLIFRGQFRLTISFAQVESVETGEGRLHLGFPEGKAVFNLGPLAEKWALKIRHPKSLLDKLGVKANSRVVTLGINDKSFIGQLKERTPDISERKRKNSDFIFLLAETKAVLKRVAPLQEYIKRNGAIWVVTPKGKQHIKEMDVLDVGKEAGLVDTKVVSFSQTHTAHKLVIPLDRR
jgi:hypothetical protein